MARIAEAGKDNRKVGNPTEPEIRAAMGKAVRELKRNATLKNIRLVVVNKNRGTLLNRVALKTNEPSLFQFAAIQMSSGFFGRCWENGVKSFVNAMLIASAIGLHFSSSAQST